MFGLSISTATGLPIDSTPRTWGGQVWRFDVFNGQPAERLIAGGVIAQLGGAPRPAPDARETRRFYYAPDVALVNTRAHQFMHIGVGSGHRARPNSPHTQDRFHALRDYAAFKNLTESEYAAMTPIAPADLVDITDNLGQTIPPGSPGWRLDLGEGGWRGEKALAESRTFNNRIFLTTFIPGTNAEDSSDPCAPPARHQPSLRSGPLERRPGPQLRRLRRRCRTHRIRPISGIPGLDCERAGIYLPRSRRPRLRGRGMCTAALGVRRFALSSNRVRQRAGAHVLESGGRSMSSRR